jgi:hypothetical protein
MMTKRNQNKRRKNLTVDYMRSGQMRFKRRLDVPMWHIDHLNKTVEILTSLTEELTNLKKNNSFRNADKCMYAQTAISFANGKLASMLPKDPRERGAEMLEYTEQGLVDHNGHAELLARDDLNQEQQQPIWRRRQNPEG